MRRFELRKEYAALLFTLLIVLSSALGACQPSDDSLEDRRNSAGANASGNAIDVAEEAEPVESDSPVETIDSVSSLSVNPDSLEPSLHTPNISEQKEKSTWEYLNGKIAYLGKNALQTVSETGYQIDYKKIGESECLILHDGGVDICSLVFSDDVWDETSRCTAVFVNNAFYSRDPEALPENARQLKAMFGEPASRFDDANSGKTYYKYVFDDIEIRFYTYETGELPAEKDILIKTVGTEIGFLPPVDVYERVFIDIGRLERPEWEQVNKYAAYIGKTWDEVKTDYPDMEYSSEYGCGIDKNTDTMFNFQSIKSTCENIYVPAGIFFSYIKQWPITREVLVTHWLEDCGWYCEYGGDGPIYFYEYNFPDILISVASESDGTIPEKFFIGIMSQTE